MMKTIQYDTTTINCNGKDYLVYFCYLWDDKQSCYVWDEDKLSYSEALERYPVDEYEWERI